MARGGYRPGAGRPKIGKHSTRAAQRMHQVALIEPLATGPFSGDSHDLLRWTYQNHLLPAGMRLEAARAAIGFERPKLAATQNFNIKTSLRDLVLESMSASGDAKAIEHQPSPPASAVIEAQPEPAPVQPVEPDGADGPALPWPSPPDGGKECTGTGEGSPQPFGPPAAAGEPRGPLPGPDPAQDSRQRFEELRREREWQRAAEASRASQPNTRPYGEPPRQYSPRSAEADDIARHVMNIRRLRGLPE